MSIATAVLRFYPRRVGDGTDQMHVDLVRSGYDVVSERYRRDDDEAAEYDAWIQSLSARLPSNSDVLDLGCGCGVPVARRLVGAGHRVVGVDLSDRQVERARRLVPEARFIRGDATEVVFPAAAFDCIVCLYVLIHVPLARQLPLLRRVRQWLRPGGVFLATVGASAWSGREDNWLGASAPMWWDHADAATYRRWFDEAGFDVEQDEFIPEGSSGHQLLLASVRPDVSTG